MNMMPKPFPILSEAERDRRWERTRNLMRQLDLEAIVGVGEQGPFLSQQYLANTRGGTLFFPRESDPVQIDGPWDAGVHYDNRLRGLRPWVADVRLEMDALSLITKLIEERGLTGKRVGVLGLSPMPVAVGGSVRHSMGTRIEEALAGVETVDIAIPFGIAMLVKSEEEIGLIRHAAQASERACEALLAECRIGARETDLHAAIVGALAREGTDISIINSLMTVEPTSMSFMGGHHWYNPQRQPRSLEEGDLVAAEIFAWYAGVDSQAQISISIGEPSPEHRMLSDVSRRAYEAAVAEIRPGAKFDRVWQAMREVILDAGCWAASPLLHSLSPVLLVGELHAGLMDADVDPSLKTPPFIPGFHDENMLIEEGMLLAVEPCAAIGHRKVMGGGGVLVTSDGAEELNRLPTHMQIVSIAS